MAITEHGIATNNELIENGCKTINQILFLGNMVTDIDTLNKCPTCSEMINTYFNIRIEDIYVESPEIYNFALVPFSETFIKPVVSVPFYINNVSDKSYYRIENIGYVITYNNGIRSSIRTTSYPGLLGRFTNATGNINTNVSLDSGSKIEFFENSMKCYVADDEKGTNSTEIIFKFSPKQYINNDNAEPLQLVPSITIGEALDVEVHKTTIVTIKTNMLDNDYYFAPIPCYVAYTDINNGLTYKTPLCTSGIVNPSDGNSYFYWSFSIEEGHSVTWQFESAMTKSDGTPILSQANRRGDLEYGDTHSFYNLIPQQISGTITPIIYGNPLSYTIECELEEI